MTRVEFRLSMPSRSSWNGGWSGEDRNYSLVRELSDDAVARLFADDASASWSHRWSDGWCAMITARIVPVGTELPKSDGFGGYEWMVDNILRGGTPYAEVTS